MGASFSLPFHIRRFNRSHKPIAEVVDNSAAPSGAESRVLAGNNSTMSNATDSRARLGNHNAVPENATPGNNAGRNATSLSQNGNLHPKQTALGVSKRAVATLLSSKWLLLAMLFLILALVGSTSLRPVVKDTYLLKLDVSESPARYAIAHMLNASWSGPPSVYQVGLWNYCSLHESNKLECSRAKYGSPFEPFPVIERVYGTSLLFDCPISRSLAVYDGPGHLPARVFYSWISKSMIQGCIWNIAISCVLICAACVSIYSRWASAVIAVLTFLNAIAVTGLVALMHYFLLVIKKSFDERANFWKIKVTRGHRMFAFLWLAATFSIISFLVHSGLMCCGASWRDIKKGRRTGNKSAYSNLDSEKAIRDEQSVTTRP